VALLSHTDLYSFSLAGETVGIVGCVIGAPFAVLIAEELFACGCRHLLSVTSAGQVVAAANPPYFVVTDRALGDEGTSYHYAAPSEIAEADPRLVAKVTKALRDEGLSVLVGASWTTGPYPFRRPLCALLRMRGNVCARRDSPHPVAFGDHPPSRAGEE
jgi:uridine phosphorylase